MIAGNGSESGAGVPSLYTKRLPRFFVRLIHFMVVLFLLSGCIEGEGYIVTPTQVHSNQDGASATVAPNTTEQPGATTEPESTGLAEKKLTQFGLLTVLPESSGSTFTPEVIAAIKATGVRYMRVAVDWAVSEPKPGEISFDSRNDQMIREIEQAGMHVFPTLYVGRGWMNGNPPGRQEGGSRSYPSDDLSSQWNESYGYSPSYYNFVYTFFSHYRGHIEYVAIENEANSKLFWGGSAEDYVRLLRTAYKAIKAADPQVTVVDSGFVSAALGLCIADDYLKNGLRTEDEALQFITDYYSEETGRTAIRTIAQLEQALSQSKIQEQCQRISYMLDNMANAVDAVNFHFYEDYRALPAVVEWLRLRTSTAGYNPAIVSNEMGIRGQSTDFAEGTVHAKEVVKKMITAMSLDLRAVIWFSADTILAGKDKVGLFDSAGKMRPAGNSLQLVIDTIEKMGSFSQASSTDPSLYHYFFKGSNGVLSLEILWTEGDQKFLQLKSPVGATQAVITDYVGESYILPIVDGSVELFVGDGPLFVLWK